MRSLRFNHVFTFLLLGSAVSAFVVAPRFTDPVRALVQGVFFPVARPTRAFAVATLGRFHHAEEIDRRADKDLRDENQRLKAALANLTREVDRLQGIKADYDRLGKIARYCTRVSVVGNAPGERDSLSVQGNFSSAMVDAPVLYEESVVGRIDRAGIGGAQVRLITDRGCSTIGRFGRFTDDGQGGLKFDPIETKSPYIDGNGNSTMVIRNLETKDARAVKEGDWVVLDDPYWPDILQFRRLGVVKQIRPRADAPLFVEILVHPQWNLLALSDVMVMNKTAERMTNDETRISNETQMTKSE